MTVFIDLFFFHTPATTEIYTYLHPLSLHASLPISHPRGPAEWRASAAAHSCSRAKARRAASFPDRYNSGPAAVPVGSGQRPQAVSGCDVLLAWADRSEEHTSELQSLMRISYAVF